MKPYKLYKAADLLEFTKICNAVIRQMRVATLPMSVQFRDLCIETNDQARIWRAYNDDLTLWHSGYSVLLTKRAAATFKYYREMSPKKLEKHLTRPIKAGRHGIRSS